MTIDEAIKHCKEEAEKYMEYGIETECYQCGKEHEQLAEWLTELKEAKQLLKLAVEDFAKLNRENAKNKNCMMPEMHCADCPLNRDSVDDRAEPCHSWRYADEALKLIES